MWEFQMFTTKVQIVNGVQIGPLIYHWKGFNVNIKNDLHFPFEVVS
jgi:hypothetical protein